MKKIAGSGSMDPRIRIHTNMSWINTGEKNVGHDEQKQNEMLCSHTEPAVSSSGIPFKARSGVQSSGGGNLRQWNPQVRFLPIRQSYKKNA
jgi:hypothetical protein